jgi:hypothetical protein
MKIIRVSGYSDDANRAEHVRIAHLVEQSGFCRYTPATTGFSYEGRDVRLWVREPELPGCHEMDWRDLFFEAAELKGTHGEPPTEVRLPLRLLRGTNLCYYQPVRNAGGSGTCEREHDFHLCTLDGYRLDSRSSSFQERASADMEEAHAQQWVMLLARHPWWPVPPEKVIAARAACLVVRTRENAVRHVLEDLVEELAYRALELPLEVALTQSGVDEARLDALKAEVARLLTSCDSPEVLVAKLKWAARGGRVTCFDRGDVCHTTAEAEARSALSDEEYDAADFPDDLDLEGSFMEHLAQYSGRVVETLRASCARGPLGMTPIDEFLWNRIHLQDTPQNNGICRLLIECLYGLEERLGTPTEMLCCLY